jgi:hypothetical protein
MKTGGCINSITKWICEEWCRSELKESRGRDVAKEWTKDLEINDAEKKRKIERWNEICRLMQKSYQSNMTENQSEYYDRTQTGYGSRYDNRYDNRGSRNRDYGRWTQSKPYQETAPYETRGYRSNYYDYDRRWYVTPQRYRYNPQIQNNTEEQEEIVRTPVYTENPVYPGDEDEIRPIDTPMYDSTIRSVENPVHPGDDASDATEVTAEPAPSEGHYQ